MAKEAMNKEGFDNEKKETKEKKSIMERIKNFPANHPKIVKGARYAVDALAVVGAGVIALGIHEEVTDRKGKKYIDVTDRLNGRNMIEAKSDGSVVPTLIETNEKVEV